MDARETTPGPGQRPSFYRRRRWLIVTLGLLALAAAGWTLAWQFVALKTKASLTAWMDQRRVLGDEIGHRRMELSGFPFRVTYVLPEAIWTRRDENGDGLRLSAGALTVSNSPISPYTLDLRVLGPLSGEIHDGGAVLPLTAASARGEVEIGRVRAERGALTLTRFRLEAPAGKRLIAADRISLALAPDGPMGDGDGSAQAAVAVPVSAVLDLDVDALEFDTDIPLPFDGPATGRGRFGLVGPVERLDPTRLDPLDLALWRDAGGVVEVRALSLDWSPMVLSGDGTFTLDRAMRPEGAATVSVAGLPAVLDRVVGLGWLPPDQAGWIKLGVRALQKPTGDGGPPRISAPLTLQNGEAFLGPIRIARLRSWGRR